MNVNWLRVLGALGFSFLCLACPMSSTPTKCMLRLDRLFLTCGRTKETTPDNTKKQELAVSTTSVTNKTPTRSSSAQ